MRMTTVTKLAALSAALVAVGGMTFYFVTSSGGEGTLPGQPETQVAGRIMHSYTGERQDGQSLVGYCEYDAWASVGGETVVSVVRSGDRSSIKPGDRFGASVDVDIYDVDESELPPGFSLEDALADRPPPPSTRDVGVYVDENRELQTGCAPESWTVIDGVGKSLAEWRAEGVID